jgi:hypothetical protein
MTQDEQQDPIVAPRGMELFEIQPIILGGSPTDPANKTWLTRSQHIEAVRWWNATLKRLRQEKR